MKRKIWTCMLSLLLLIPSQIVTANESTTKAAAVNPTLLN